MSAAVRAAFDRFDKGRSGFLDYRELRNALKHKGTTCRRATRWSCARDDYPDGKLVTSLASRSRLGAAAAPPAARPAGGGVPAGRRRRRAAAAVDRGAQAGERRGPPSRDRMQREGMLTVHLQSASGSRRTTWAAAPTPCHVQGGRQVADVARRALDAQPEVGREAPLHRHAAGDDPARLPLSLYDHDRNTTNESLGEFEVDLEALAHHDVLEFREELPTQADRFLIRWEKTGAASCEEGSSSTCRRPRG